MTGEGPAVAVVNETLARQAYPNEDPVGRIVRIGDERDAMRIVGIVGDVRQTDLRTEVTPEMYLPWMRSPWRRIHMVARVSGDPAVAIAEVRDAVRAIDADVPLVGPRLLTGVVEGTYASTGLIASLMVFFGLTGLALSAIGVYGVTSMAASERQRDIGIRIALGARVQSVFASMLMRGLAPVAFGVVVGLLVALAAGRLMEGLVFGVGVRDPWTLAAAPAVLAGVAVTSVLVPTLRASRVDPVATLREE